MKETPYFGDVPDSVVTSIKLAHHDQLRIQTDDILNITLLLTDPVSNSNLNNVTGAGGYSSNLNSTNGQYVIGGGQNAIGADGVGFLVDSIGQVNLPLFGKVTLAGLTTDKARDLIQSMADKLYKHSSANVRFSNLKIGVLGEVNNPGYFYMGNEKNTILDALLKAGDLTIYGKRNNIILMRDSAGYMTMRRISLDSKNLINQPYFYLKQRDILYIEPNKSKIQSLNSPVYTKIGLAISVLTLLVLVWTRIDK